MRGFVCLLLCLLVYPLFAQKYAVIDVEYILNKIPEYKLAEVKLKDITTSWQKEIDNDQAEIDKMNKNFLAEQYFLTERLKEKRRADIEHRENELRNLQTRRFGFQGDLFKQRQILIKPIQDRVYNAIQRIALSRGYDCVFDKSQGITVIYSDPKVDKSEEILRELGIK
ncbi:MAG: OmpH family outer membrane protein [Phycisphaerales bacterium]|nr:OmpH family outer membrane protein [Phycisphaerales bacterium]